MIRYTKANIPACIPPNPPDLAINELPTVSIKRAANTMNPTPIKPNIDKNPVHLAVSLRNACDLDVICAPPLAIELS